MWTAIKIRANLAAKPNFAKAPADHLDSLAAEGRQRGTTGWAILVELSLQTPCGLIVCL